jgi:hypothetical protein
VVLCTSVTPSISPPKSVDVWNAVKARALSRPFPVVLNERRGHVSWRSAHAPASLRCAPTVLESILVVLAFGSNSLAAGAAYHWLSFSKHGQDSKHSSRKAQRAEVQVQFACHTGSHLRHHSRPALLSDPSILQFFTCASHQQLIIFLLTLLTSRSTQELLFAFGLVCMFANYC